jgi:hypothetical protein
MSIPFYPITLPKTEVQAKIWLFAAMTCYTFRSQGLTMPKEEQMIQERNLSIPGGLTGAVLGVAAELALEELTGMEVVGGLLAVIGAGFGLIRIDRRIYEATVNLVKRVPVEPTSDYRDVLEQIDEMSIELPELRESFVKLIRAGIEAQRA